MQLEAALTDVDRLKARAEAAESARAAAIEDVTRAKAMAEAAQAEAAEAKAEAAEARVEAAEAALAQALAEAEVSAQAAKAATERSGSRSSVWKTRTRRAKTVDDNVLRHSKRHASRREIVVRDAG